MNGIRYPSTERNEVSCGTCLSLLSGFLSAGVGVEDKDKTNISPVVSAESNANLPHRLGNGVGERMFSEHV